MKARLILFLILLCLFTGSASAQKYVISIDPIGDFVCHDSKGDPHFLRRSELIGQEWKKRSDSNAPIQVEEGTRIHIRQSEPAPEGKYLSGWRSNPSSVSVTHDNNWDEWVFNVPSHNISFSPVYRDQEPFTVRLESDSARVPTGIYWDVLMSTKIDEYSYDAGMFITVDDETVIPVLDLDMNGTPDISINPGPGEDNHTYRVLSTNSVKGSITIKGLNLSRDTIYSSRYNPVTFVFDKFKVTEVNHGQKYSKTNGGTLKVVVKSTLTNEQDPFDAFFEKDASGNVRRQGRVYMNKKLVDPSNYRVRRGSLEIIFTPQFLASLPNGKQIVDIEMPHGETVSSDVEIEGPPVEDAAANLPRTGDQENLMLWGGLGAAGILAFLLML